MTIPFQRKIIVLSKQMHIRGIWLSCTSHARFEPQLMITYVPIVEPHLDGDMKIKINTVRFKTCENNQTHLEREN
jgi:hypothetical protein